MQPKKYRTIDRDIPPQHADFIINGSSSRWGGPAALVGQTNGGGQAAKQLEETITSNNNSENGHTNGDSVTTSSQMSISNGSLLTRQALKTYSSDHHLIQYKYDAYSGTSLDFPK